ncbi:MAG: hypothetical protein ACOVP4_02185 [Bacteriovoracaceae bacterium]
MKRLCPHQNCAAPNLVIKDGYYKRLDDAKKIQRYRCKSCGLRFSAAVFSSFYRQKKRRINSPLLKLLCSGVSLRRSALLLNVSKNTVSRKLPLLAKRARQINQRKLLLNKSKISCIQLDDLITKENSKLRPLSVSVAVDEKRRSILAVEVSQIPAFGHLAKLGRKKYGYRQDRHAEGLERLFQTISHYEIDHKLKIKSDEHGRYPKVINKFFPWASHERFKSERAHIAGQGELKKVQFDPLFAINHTCAILRANINRLIRRTWCTTKDPARLQDHLDLFVNYYNHELLPKSKTPL